MRRPPPSLRLPSPTFLLSRSFSSIKLFSLPSIFSLPLSPTTPPPRHSIENLWRNLSDTNPELVSDFEEFVAEIASEVEGAQRALK